LAEAQYYRFIRFPWIIWDFDFIFLIITLYVSYVIYKERIQNIYLILFNILMYYIYFIILYAGKIEKLTVNKKKGIIKLTYYNMFCSKKERVKKIDDVKDIEIVRKGIVKAQMDTTKYYIRITYNDDSKFDWGEAIHFINIDEKYRQTVALIKEIILPDVITDDYITDEAYDENYDNYNIVKDNDDEDTENENDNNNNNNKNNNIDN